MHTRKEKSERERGSESESEKERKRGEERRVEGGIGEAGKRDSWQTRAVHCLD